jgi:hypothetical protein
LDILNQIPPAYVGLGFLVAFLILMLVYMAALRSSDKNSQEPLRLRVLPAFNQLKRALVQSVETGKRIHVSLGRAGLNGLPGASALAGMGVQRKILQSSMSDLPELTTVGSGEVVILAQDISKDTYKTALVDQTYDPNRCQVSGVTPYTYAVGTLPVIFDEQVSVSYLAGHFGSEVGLIAEAAERAGSLTVAGSDSLTAQAVLYAAAQEPLIGEELYAGAAYVAPDPVILASIRAQDILRWGIVLFILIGIGLKLAGVL